ncbi:MAG: hypothetical protein U0Q15_05105, partial [Kineosporiaceae bacterium]
SGVLSGTPTTAALTEVEVQVRDSAGRTGFGFVTIRINPASSGPTVTRVDVLGDLTCTAEVAAFDDHPALYYGDTACGTFLQVDDRLFGPGYLPAGPEDNALWDPVSQTRTGAGTAGDPYVITTVVDAGDTGVRLTQTDRWVEGAPTWSTTATVTSASGPHRLRLSRAHDCYVETSDTGWGAAGPGGSTWCTGETSQMQLVPDTAGSTFMEGFYDSVWNAVRARADLPDTVDPSYHDNAQALSWSLAGPSTVGWHSTLVWMN